MSTYKIRTAAKALLIQNRQILLIEHKRDSIYYTLPGGGQNHNEPLQDTVIRECQEELGAFVKVKDLAFVFEYIADHHIGSIQKEGFHQLDFVFACDLVDDQPFIEAIETDCTQVGYRWIPLESLMDIVLYPMALREKIITYSNQGKTGIYLGEMR